MATEKKTIKQVDDDIKKQVVDKIIEAFKNGSVPWQKRWNDVGGNIMCPRNPITNTQYSGANRFILALSGHSSGLWVTSNQLNALSEKMKANGTDETLLPKIKKDEYKKASMITFVSKIEGRERTVKDKDTGEEKTERPTVLMRKVYWVYNADQIENFPHKEFSKVQPLDFDPIERAERIADAFKATGLTIEHGGNRAFYSPLKDHVQMPPREHFKSIAGYYGTLMHELGHSTMAEHRLNRPEAFPKAFGDANYASEEARNELANAIWSAHVNIPWTDEMLQHSATYIMGWLEDIAKDPNLFFKTCHEAEQIVEYCLTREKEYLIENNLEVANPVQEQPTVAFNSNIAAEPNNAYAGKVIDITPTSVIQLAGRRRIEHDISKIEEPTKLKIGSRMLIDYRSKEKAQITDLTKQFEKSKTASKSKTQTAKKPATVARTKAHTPAPAMQM